MSNIQTVLSALNVFSTETDKSSIETANSWLQEFQHSPEAWSTCNVLLLSDESPTAARIFAAQTFRTKITFDLYQLDSNQLFALRDTLIGALEKFVSGPKVIQVQLSLALSGLALQFPAWEDAFGSIVDKFGQSPIAIPLLLEFLIVLPEEITSNTRIPVSNDEYRKRSKHILSDNSRKVLELLSLYMTASGVTYQIQSQVLNCLRSWLVAGEISAIHVIETPLFPYAFEALTSPELFDAAVETICDLIHETQEVEENMPAIELILSKLIQIKPHISAIKDDTDKIRGYTRIFSEAGEVYRMLLLQNPESFFPIVEAVGECTSYPDLDVVPITFHFWMRLAQCIGKRSNVPTPFFDAYKSLMGVIIQHLRFPSDEESVSPKEAEEFRSFRHVMGDTLKDCCYVLGTEVCLTLVYELIMSAMGNGNLIASAGVPWQEIEAPLFSLRSVGAEIDTSDDIIIPRIMDLLPTLPNHNRVKYAAILVISRYSEWTSRHPDYIQYQLQFISSGFESGDSEVLAAAAQAMKYLCQDCKRHMIPYLPQLHTFLGSVGPNLIQEDRSQVYEAIAHVITAMPMESAAQTLHSFSFELLSKIQIFVGLSNGGSKEETKDASNNLENLEVMLHIMQTFGEQLPAACQGACEEAWSILDSLLAIHAGNVEICERANRVIRHGLKLFALSSRQCILAVLERMSNSFSATGFSSYLWISGKIVGLLGHNYDHSEFLACKLMYEISTAKVLEMLQKKDPRDIPDVIEDYLHCLMQLVQFMPAVLYQSTAFTTTIQAAIAALSLIHTDIILVSLDFIRSVVLDESLRNTLTTNTSVDASPQRRAICEAIQSTGLQLCGSLLSGLIGSFPEEALPATVTIHRTMCSIWPEYMEIWLPQILERLQDTPSFMSAKQQFLTDTLQAIVNGDLEKVKHALLEFHRFSVKARERRRVVNSQA